MTRIDVVIAVATRNGVGTVATFNAVVTCSTADCVVVDTPYIEERLKLDIQTDVRNPIGREEHPDDWWELIDTKRK